MNEKFLKSTWERKSNSLSIETSFFFFLNPSPDVQLKAEEGWGRCDEEVNREGKGEERGRRWKG